MALFEDFFIEEQPRRKRKPISKLINEGLYKRQRGRCMYCGRKVALADMHVDHKTPVNRNGSDSEKNLQILCGPCNTRKGAMTDGEFRRAYQSVGLKSAREAKGQPPAKSTPLKKFEAVSKERSAKRAKQRGRRRDDDWLW